MENVALTLNNAQKQFRFKYYSIFLLLSLIIFPKFTSAQSIPPAGVNIPPTLPEILDQTIPKPSPSSTPSTPTNPTAPILPSPAIPTPSDTTFPNNESFLVKKIDVLGATVLKNEIAKLIQPLQNRQVTFADLLKLRSDITELYISNGYITSGAFLPNNQRLTDGVVKIQVVEGELEKIEITGLRRLRSVVMTQLLVTVLLMFCLVVGAMIF